MEALKLLLVFAAIVFALRKRVSVGVSLFGAGLLMALLFQVPVGQLWAGYLDLLRSQSFIFLTALVVLVTILGNLLKDLGFLVRLAQACQGLPGGSRTAVIVMPGLVGLMPMPGGALLSAPLVNSVLQDSKYTPQFKCAANYWFRHLVEFCWPVYAGLVLTEAITGLAIGRVALLQLPLSAAMIAIGWVYFGRHIANGSTARAQVLQPFVGIARTIWPVVSAILVHAIFGLDLMIAIGLSIIALVVVTRPHRAVIWAAVKEGFSVSLIFLIFGILSFQTVLELSGGVEAVSRFASAYDFPQSVLVFVVTFTIGILTGMVSAYVGLGYVLCAGLLFEPTPQPGLIMIAYLGGFAGMILSPAHLCLVLTNNYFQSDLLKVFRTLILPLAVLVLFGFGLYLAGWGDLFR